MNTRPTGGGRRGPTRKDEHEMKMIKADVDLWYTGVNDGVLRRSVESYGWTLQERDLTRGTNRSFGTRKVKKFVTIKFICEHIIINRYGE